MPSMMLFFLPGINLQATAGFYGSQPNDAQFLIVLFYAGFAGFYVLERRFFQFFQIKTYYILFHGLQLLNCMLMYWIKDIWWIYPLRVFQGMLFASAVILSISMIFSRMESSKAKIGSYSVFFGLLLVSSPFNNLVFSSFVDDINFKQLYAFAALSFLPGFFLIAFLMKHVKHQRPFPLYKLDWASFILYLTIFCCLGYMAVYGQEMYWFSSYKIIFCTFLIVISFLLFRWRQKHNKRMYIQFDIFKSKRFWMGCFVLFVMYIERFSITLTNQHFSLVYGLDPEHLSYLNVFDIIGITIGVIVASKWTLTKVPIKYIWICGFFFLFIFHWLMFNRFVGQADEDRYWAPLLAHGVGVGLIMVPTILFAISTVREQFSVSAAAICLGIRFLGYVAFILIINYFELAHRSIHFEHYRQVITADNTLVHDQIALRSNELISHGLQYNQQQTALKELYKDVYQQAQIRTAMDFYEYMMLVSACMIVTILLFPTLKFRYEKWREMKIAPV